MLGMLIRRICNRPLQLKLGGTYKNADGDIVVIDRYIEPLSRMGMMGYDFISTTGDTYCADGKFCRRGNFVGKDLVSEL